MKSCEEMYQEVQPLIETDRQEDAIRALEKMLGSYPEFAPAHYELGALYFNRGHKTKALEHYHESINLEPLNAAFLKGLADCYYVALGNAAEATKLYHKVIEIDPNDITALMILGNLAVVENRFDIARDFYQRVLAIEPWNHEALSLLEKFDRRKKAGDKEQIPESSYLHIQELINSGNIKEAIKELENLLAIQPEYGLAHNDLGVLYYQCGRTEKTLVHYEEAVRLEPDNPTFQKNLADFYYIEQSRIQDALEIYLKVLSEEPTDIETLMAAAQICKALNRNEQAKIFFDRVLDLEPWNLEADENLNKLKPSRSDNGDASFKNLNF
jgi:cytochrome c-type biogenesis protein CcmH/NrfG